MPGLTLGGNLFILAGMRKRTDLADPHKQAGWFKKLREDHQQETAEDYVELIYDLIEARGEARVTDLSQRFAVSHATVNKVVKRLKGEGLVVNEKYRSIFLTDKGRELAIYCRKRHDLVVNFLEYVGVSSKTAEIDAEGVEHHVSEETLAAFQAFIDKVRLE